MNKERTTKYLSALGLPMSTIQEYVLNGTVNCSTSRGIRVPDPDVQQIMEQLQVSFGDEYEIYHVVVSEKFGCVLYNFLLRPANKEEDNYIFDGLKEGCVLSYTWNTAIPEYSEPGNIYVWFNQRTKSLTRID